MELSGEVAVAAPRERVWAALNDTEVLRRCIPGCESLSDDGGDGRVATVAVKAGPVRARFTGRVRLADVRAGEGCTLQFDGQGGAAGMARGTSRVELLDDPDAPGATRLRYATQASVAGKLGQVGGRMIDAAARQMADQFFAAFRAEVAPPVAPPVTPPTAPVAVAPELETGPTLVDGPGRATAAAASTPATDGPRMAVAPPAGSAPSPARAPSPAFALAPSPSPSPSSASAFAPASAPVLAPPPTLAPRPASVPMPAASWASAEMLRVLWFVLGALSTGFGVWLARVMGP